ncbi:hypothetical protein AAMO2058_000554800 [Amorphochlora amoebiformis]
MICFRMGLRWIVVGFVSLCVVQLAIMIALVGGPSTFYHLLEQKIQPNLPKPSRLAFGSPMSRILVTGSNRGLGLAISKVLLRSSDAQVIMSGRTRDKCELQGRKLISELRVSPDRISFESLDLSKIQDTNSFIQRAKDKGLIFESVILNAAVAGIHQNDILTGLNPIISVNFFGNVYLTHSLLKEGLIREKGSIIVVTSGLHMIGSPTIMAAREAISPSNAHWMYGQSKLLLQTWFDGLLHLNPNPYPKSIPKVLFWNPGPVDTYLGGHSVPTALIPTYRLMKYLFFVEPEKVAVSILHLLSNTTMVLISNIEVIYLSFYP